MAALGCNGERGGDGSGGERERRGGRGRAWGRAGGAIEEAGGAGDLIPHRRRREGAAGTHPCSDPGQGNRERRRQGEAGRFGRVGQVAGAVASWAFRPRGEGGFLLFPFCIFFIISFLFNFI